MVAWGSTNSYFLSLRGGHKRGGEGGKEGKSAKKGKMKGSLPSLPNPSPFFPSSLSPTPFDAWLLFSRRVKQESKKVSAPRRGRLLDGEYRNRFAAIGKILSQRVFSKKLTLN